MKRAKIAIVYHRIDFDGICSFAIACQQIELANALSGHEVDITPVPWNRGDGIPCLDTFEDIYILDIAFPAEIMCRLNEKHRLVWIDHHSTTIDEMDAAGLANVPGIRRQGVGACELTWEYFARGQKAPKQLLLLSAYDVWDKERFDWENVTLPFQYGMRNRFGLDAARFLNEFPFGRMDENAFIDDIIKEGRIIINYVRKTGYNMAMSYGIDITFDGQPALLLLTDTPGCFPYVEAAKDMGARVLVLANVHMKSGDNCYKLSAYVPDASNDIHAGRYLKEKYINGGGHAGAAGCIIPENEFLRIMHEKTI